MYTFSVLKDLKPAKANPIKIAMCWNRQSLSGAALVELAYETGIAPNQLNEYRMGRKSPGYETLRKLYRVNSDLVIDLLEIKDSKGR